MELSSRSFAFILSPFLFSCFFLLTSCFALMQPLCHDEERLALLQFKQRFVLNPLDSTCSSSSPMLSSWKIKDGNGNCCSWDGVECDYDTGHVIGLDLNRTCLYGSIDSNSSLFRLVHLQMLSLANNNFNYSKIPAAIGDLLKLSHLDLSFSQFSGQIPYEILKLRNLSFLYLSYNVDIISKKPLLELQSLDFRILVLNLKSLVGLDLSMVNISSTVPDILANFSSLKFLVLRQCELQGKFPEKIFQLQNLQIVNIMNNPNLYGYLPQFNSNNSLKKLQLQGTGFNGKLPFSIGNLLSLNNLNLGGCNFSGSIPFSLGNLSELNTLDLNSNKFTGPIPSSLENLTKLEFLQLTNNDFSDTTSLTPWLQKQRELYFLGLSGINLSGNILNSLDNLTQLEVLFLSSNYPLSGHFPSSISNMSSLKLLEMNVNDMIGTFPHWLGNLSKSLEFLLLGGSRFEGSIPNNTFERDNNLRFIDLSNLKLQGKVPRSLSNCKMLEFLDLGSNQLNDVFPSWLGTLPNLRFLGLRSNRFYGPIDDPKTSFEFPKLHIIDLSYNNFSGNLPFKFINQWNAMKTFSSNSSYVNVTFTSRSGEFFQMSYPMKIIHKGSDRFFMEVLEVFSAIDLSCNRFEGEIPYFIGNLRGLQSLNFSHNMLTGQIPSSLENMTQLESLDLSYNDLSGNIPQLSKLIFLAIFNVSYNNLSGPVPRGNQFDIMDSSSYEGNSGLCGVPLSNKCGNSDTEREPPPKQEQEQDDQGSFFQFGWKIVVIGYGCGVVFGIIIS